MGRADEAGAGLGLCREPRRRGRHARHHGGQARRSGRPRSRARQHQHDGAEHHDHEQCELRTQQGLRADRDLLRQHHLDRGASVGAGEQRQGADRSREGQCRQGVVRLGRHRHDEPPVRRTVQGEDRTERRGAHSLQGRGTRHGRPGQRAHPDDVAEHQRPGARVPQDRQDQDPGDQRQAAAEGRAGHSDRDRARACRT